MKYRFFIGHDVLKLTIDVAALEVITSQQIIHHVFANDASG